MQVHTFPKVKEGFIWEKCNSISFMHQLKLADLVNRSGSWLRHLQVSSGKLSSSSRVNQSLPAVLVPIFFIKHEWFLTVSTQMKRIWEFWLTVKTRFCQQWWWKGNTINDMHNLLYYWLFSLCSFWDCAPGSQISTFTNQDVNVFPRGLLLKTLVSCKAELQISPTLGNTTQPNPHTGHQLYLTTHLSMFQHCIDRLMEYIQSCPPKKYNVRVRSWDSLGWNISQTHPWVVRHTPEFLSHFQKHLEDSVLMLASTQKTYANCCNIIIYLLDGRIRQVVKLINVSSGYCCTCSETW